VRHEAEDLRQWGRYIKQKDIKNSMVCSLSWEAYSCSLISKFSTFIGTVFFTADFTKRSLLFSKLRQMNNPQIPPNLSQGKDHNSQTQQQFEVILIYIITLWGTCFDSYRVILRPSRCRSRHRNVYCVVGSPQNTKFYIYPCILYILFCKRWGSHNAVNICMSGSASWRPEDDSIWVETCSQ